MIGKLPEQSQENWRVLIYPGSPLATSAGGAYRPKNFPNVGKGVLPGAFHDPHIHKHEEGENVAERSIRYAMFSMTPIGNVL